jgi:putative membrane protein
VLVSESDRKRIAAAIRAAEERTHGEIFCVLAGASSHYRLVPLAWAILIALAVPLPLIYLTRWPAGVIYLVQLAVFLASAFALSLPAIRFRTVPRRAKRDRAHTEAMRQFLAQGLHLTQERTGVLIFASLAERHAEIVADVGINAKVDAEAWTKAVATLTAALKDGRPADGFVAAVAQCGAVLAEHFPCQPGEPKRAALPDELVEI